MGRFTGILGLLTMLVAAYAFSTNRRAIRLKTVLWGLGLQFVFAIFVLRIDAGRAAFQKAGDAVTKLLSYAHAGSHFVFGDLANPRIYRRISEPQRQIHFSRTPFSIEYPFRNAAAVIFFFPSNCTSISSIDPSPVPTNILRPSTFISPGSNAKFAAAAFQTCNRCPCRNP